MKMGAFDFVRKEQLPFNLKVVADAALLAAAELRSANAFKPQLTVEQHRDEIVGRSEAMQQVFKMVGRVAGSDAAVMVTGESGAGKELVACAIHNYSARSNRSFLAINCAAIPENLLESELFGHEKGAFTGAATQRVGRFEQCNKGTLFLDEIGEMPLQVQSKILRVLQEGTFSRVGGNETLHTDVRIVCATNRNLEEEVAKRTFREDLFYRLNVVRIHIPPLRQRVDDIRLLAEYFLQKIANRTHTPPLKLTEEAVRVLESYPWPGNVRELENTLQRASVLSTADIPLGVASPEATKRDDTSLDFMPKDRAVEVLFQAAAEDPSLPLLPWIEREFTLRAMQKTGDNQVRAAKMLGITRATLRKRLDRNSAIEEEEE
jgi:DNA-binding NtrC family response regulator